MGSFGVKMKNFSNLGNSFLAYTKMKLLLKIFKPGQIIDRKEAIGRVNTKKIVSKVTKTQSTKCLERSERLRRRVLSINYLERSQRLRGRDRSTNYIKQSERVRKRDQIWLFFVAYRFARGNLWNDLFFLASRFNGWTGVFF